MKRLQKQNQVSKKTFTTFSNISQKLAFFEKNPLVFEKSLQNQ